MNSCRDYDYKHWYLLVYTPSYIQIEGLALLLYFPPREGQLLSIFNTNLSSTKPQYLACIFNPGVIVNPRGLVYYASLILYAYHLFL